MVYNSDVTFLSLSCLIIKSLNAAGRRAYFRENYQPLGCAPNYFWVTAWCFSSGIIAQNDFISLMRLVCYLGVFIFAMRPVCYLRKIFKNLACIWLLVYFVFLHDLCNYWFLNVYRLLPWQFEVGMAFSWRVAKKQFEQMPFCIRYMSNSIGTIHLWPLKIRDIQFNLWDVEVACLMHPGMNNNLVLTFISKGYYRCNSWICGKESYWPGNIKRWNSRSAQGVICSI